MVYQQRLRNKEINNLRDGDKKIALHYFDNSCCYCGVKLILRSGFDHSVEFDHYISLSEQDEEYLVLDGTIQNRVPSCRKCNRMKSDTNPEEWIHATFRNADEIIEKILIFFALNEEYLW